MTVLNGEPRQRPLISRGPNDKYEPALNDYFLANRSLSTSSVVNLLLSSAFGVNAILYAAWLGYLMGLWALSIQIAWSVSYLLLSRFVHTVSGATSLHDFLGQRFGIATRRVAAVASIVGLTYFVGWEVSIAKVALGGLATAGRGTPEHGLFIRASLFIGVGAAVAIIFSSLFGRRADAKANRVLNVVKSTLLIGSVAVLAVSAAVASHSVLGHQMFPPLGKAIVAVGVIGLVTSLLFNLAWQFVDNSSWQSFNSGSAADPGSMAKNLKQSALWVFLTVNSLATLIGMLMRGVSGVNSNNILVQMTQTVPHLRGVLILAVCILVFASMISLVDVIVLAVTQALIVDVGVLERRMTVVRRRHARIAMLVVGLCAAWGVQAWVNWLGGSIFNFVYIVIIAQLSLIGPVLIGLFKRHTEWRHMWLIIFVSGTVGLLASIIGSALSISALVDGAGALTVFVSIIGALGVAGIGKGVDRMALDS